MGNLGFGVDIGGSGIKGAVVDLDQVGQLATERYKILNAATGDPFPAVVDVAAKWSATSGGKLRSGALPRCRAEQAWPVRPPMWTTSWIGTDT